MAARANWKGYLRLSLVSCPIALYPATSESEKVRFNQLNKNTGNRIRYMKVDAETGEEVDSEDIVKGYQVSKGHYIEITDEDLEAVSVESTRTIDIDQFVPREEIDDLYNIRPYYIAPEGKVGADAFVTIREAIAATGKVALGRLVLTHARAHHCAGASRQGSDGHAPALPLRGPRRGGLFRGHPQHQDRQGDARSRQAHRADQVRPLRTGQVRGPLRDGGSRGDQEEGRGEKIEAKRPEQPSNVINLMDALKQSLAAERGEKAPASAQAGRKAPKPLRKKRAPAKAAKKVRKAG